MGVSWEGLLKQSRTLLRCSWSTCKMSDRLAVPIPGRTDGKLQHLLCLPLCHWLLNHRSGDLRADIAQRCGHEDPPLVARLVAPVPRQLGSQPLFGSPFHQDHNIVGSILRPLILGNRRIPKQGPFRTIRADWVNHLLA